MRRFRIEPIALIFASYFAELLCSIVNQQDASKLNLNQLNSETATLPEQVGPELTGSRSTDSRRRTIDDGGMPGQPIYQSDSLVGAPTTASGWTSNLKCDQQTNGCSNGGNCANGSCVCEPGWGGQFCESCAGRIVKKGLSGFISDGSLNYSGSIKCTWLLQNPQYDAVQLDDVNITDNPLGFIMSLDFIDFCTECCWDNLHLFDGDSIFSRKLAAVSGCQLASNTKYFKLSSNSVFVFFSSDSAYNMSGFNISYKFSSCADLCKRPCDPATHLCNCLSNSTENHCPDVRCSKNCHNGQCSNENCRCKSGFKGRFCNISSSDPAWTLINPEYPSNTSGFEPAAGLAMLAVDKSLWWFGGYTFDTPKNLTISRYNIALNIYQRVGEDEDFGLVPQNRYDHTVVFHNEKFYMFGGVLEPFNITNELWSLDFSDETPRWTKRGPHKTGYLASQSPPFHVHGHTSHVIDHSMFVFFGYNPYRSYLNVVQEYNIVNNSWSRLETFGAKPPGLYGHASALDPRTNTIFVYGGYGAISMLSGKLYDNLYAFQASSRRWTVLPSSGLPLFLHSLTFFNNLLVVIGGNGHNESSNLKTKCFSDTILAYHIDCSAWKVINPVLDKPLVNLAFYGHSAAAFKNEIFVYGGFNGRFQDKLLQFSPSDCSGNRDKDSCTMDSWSKGSKCIWSKNFCSPLRDKEQPFVKQPASAAVQSFKRLSNAGGSSESMNKADIACRAPTTTRKSDCQRLNDCQSCTSSTPQTCSWCASSQRCLAECADGTVAISSLQNCPATPLNCSLFYSCNSCKHIDNCLWDRRNKFQHFACLDNHLYEKTVEDSTLPSPIRDQASTSICYKPCVFINSCEACSKAGCIWCPSAKRCVDTNGYLTAFPYSQCLQYSNTGQECAATVDCAMHLTCNKCQNSGPGCGWCDDGSQTGLGHCVDGGVAGPLDQWTPNQPDGGAFFCSFNRWFFTDCPDCQCNGHAKCTPFASADRLPAAVRPPASSAASRRLNESLWWLTSADPSASSHVPQRLTLRDDANAADSAAAVVWRRSHVGGKTPLRFLGLGSPMHCLPCSGKTTGEQCETCVDGYYGNALNGGNCSACECNGHAKSCNPYSGKCYCSTKGILGQHCDKCDSKYTGNAINATCYYDLLPDYIYTFNLNTEEDVYVTKINFMCRPLKPDIDVSFKLTCSSLLGEPGKIDLNITNDFDTARGLSPRRLLKGYPCHEIQRTFATEEFQFGTDINTTFFITLHSFKNPAINISFAQSQNIDWMRFFITFALCFFILLVLAFILWKIKQKLDVYRRRQRLFLEMAQMANRPFGSVHLDWSSISGPIKKQCPTVVAVEPCADYQAAVVTVAMRLPTGGAGDGRYAPRGQSALAFGSALCQLPAHHVAQLQTPPTPPPPANEEKAKRWRRPACIS